MSKKLDLIDPIKKIKKLVLNKRLEIRDKQSELNDLLNLEKQLETVNKDIEKFEKKAKMINKELSDKLEDGIIMKVR